MLSADETAGEKARSMGTMAMARTNTTRMISRKVKPLLSDILRSLAKAILLIASIDADLTGGAVHCNGSLLSFEAQNKDTIGNGGMPGWIE